MEYHTPLTQEANRKFESLERELEEPALSLRGKRVFVDSNTIVLSRNGDSSTFDVWNFLIPPKSFEVWALLLGIDYQGFIVADFVIPQKVFSQPFAKAKKSLKKDEKIPVTVRKDGDSFLLSIHGGEAVSITDLQNNYEPLQ